MNCIYPNCASEATRHFTGEKRWCEQHYGLYPHNCVEPGCESRVAYDDEPRCFKHSPDSGSSVRGYSYYESQVDKVDGLINSIIGLSQQIQSTNQH